MTQNKNLLLLPQYSYHGPAATMEGAIEHANEGLRGGQVATSAKEMSKEAYESQLGALNECVEELGWDLGLDISSRLPASEKVHLYTHEEFGKVREDFSLVLGSVAVNTLHGDVYATAPASGPQALYSTTHEIVHLASNHALKLYPIYKDDEVRLGLEKQHNGYSNSRHGTFNTLNEILTEMTSLELKRHYWPQHPELAEVAEEELEEIGYHSSVVFFDELLKHYYDDPRDIFKKLQRGMFTGDMGVLRVLTEKLGSETMGRIARVDYLVDEDIIELAGDLGLTEVKERIENNSQNDLVSWL